MDAHALHEQTLAAARHELAQQIDINDYRDSHGHPARHNLAFLKAQAVVDKFGLTHEQLCKTLDDCEDNLGEAASRSWRFRRMLAAVPPGTAREGPLASLASEAPTPFRAPD